MCVSVRVCGVCVPMMCTCVCGAHMCVLRVRCTCVCCAVCACVCCVSRVCVLCVLCACVCACVLCVVRAVCMCVRLCGGGLCMRHVCVHLCVETSRHPRARVPACAACGRATPSVLSRLHPGVVLGFAGWNTCAQNHPASPDLLTGGAEHPGRDRATPDGPRWCTAGGGNADGPGATVL